MLTMILSSHSSRASMTMTRRFGRWVCVCKIGSRMSFCNCVSLFAERMAWILQGTGNGRHEDWVVDSKLKSNGLKDQSTFAKGKPGPREEE
jgi:hypothetical protein